MVPQHELIFPVEIILRILSLLSPLDVAHLRLVCKEFRSITYDPLIWRTIYANAPLLLPPGPFISQSAHSLEHHLLRSTRLEKVWTTEPVQKLESKVIRVGASPRTGYPRMVDGRWLITCLASSQFVLHDMDSTTRPPCSQVLWENEYAISSWDACSISSPDGLLVYVVFSHSDSSSSCKLVEFQLDSDTGQVYGHLSWDVPITAPFGCIGLSSDQSPFLYDASLSIVFDTRSRNFYNFPEFTSELVPRMRSEECPYTVLLTDTHILGLFFCPDGTTMVQAFIVPISPTRTSRGTCVLQRTHETVMQGKVSRLLIIKRSSFDPVSGNTKLRFLLLRGFARSPMQHICVDFILPNAHDGIVLPISIHEHDLFKTGIQDQHMHGYHCYTSHSLDGNVRGMFVAYPRYVQNRQLGRFIPSSGIIVMKFMIDATPDECADVVGRASPPGNGDVFNFPPSSISYDGIRGRLCYYNYGQTFNREHAEFVVVDIK